MLVVHPCNNPAAAKIGRDSKDDFLLNEKPELLNEKKDLLFWSPFSFIIELPDDPRPRMRKCGRIVNID